MYISLWHQELRTCKRIGMNFYCEELFVVKHKTKYNCERVIYFDLGTGIIKENCNFRFYYNKMDVTPTVLDGGNEIILFKWLNDKHIICIINNDTPVRILVIHMLWYTEAFCVIVVQKQIITIFLGHWLHAIVNITK